MAGAVGLARGALRLRRREPPRREEGHEQPVLHVRSVASASSARAACAPARKCRARSRSRSTAAASSRRSARARTKPFLDSECVSCGACVQACPTATLTENVADREGRARALGRHDLRLLRRRLLVPRRDEGPRSRAHGAEQGRPREPRPLVREGPLRVRLRDAQRPHQEADDPRDDPRAVARSLVGRSVHVHGQQDQEHSDEVRQGLRRRHHVVALHERGNLPRAEARARRVRQQQRRHLRARLPLADRLRPEGHARRVGRHAGVRFRDEVRRVARDRRESDRRASRVRVADEAPLA